MINILLQRIKELESKLDEIYNKNQKTKEEILSLFKECKIDKTKKENFKKRLLKVIDNLEFSKNEEFFNGLALRYKTFVEIAKNLNNGYLVIINANYDEEIKNFILGFLINKISPFFTIDNDVILGLIDEKQFNEIKSINSIPYFNPKKNDFIEIPLKKIIFDTDNFDFNTLETAKKIFKEFQKRPSYKNKHYIEFSLIKNKIVDFEREKLDKAKEKYAFIYDETYPNLEFKLKQEIKNIPFVLAVLERIDKEIDEIKNSRGIKNIVNRILNYIELHIPEFSEEVKLLRAKIRDE